MNYNSPLHILQYFKDEDSAAEIDLNRLKKKFLAEFNLLGNTEIIIEGKPYTKDAILKQLEDLKGVGNLDVHKAIFENKSALKFFEDPTQFPDIKAIKLIYEKLTDANHKSYFQSLLFQSYSIFIKGNITKRFYLDSKHSLALMELLNEFERTEIYETIYKSLNNLDEYLLTFLNPEEEIHLSKQQVTDKLSFIYKNNISILLNYLPEEFSHMRRELANTLTNLISHGHNNKVTSKEFNYLISKELIKINIADDENLKRIIEDNHRVFQDTYEGNEKSKSGSDSNSGFGDWRWLWIVVIIAINAFRFCGHDKSYETSNVTFSDSQKFEPYEDVTINLVTYKNVIKSADATDDANYVEEKKHIQYFVTGSNPLPTKFDDPPPFGANDTNFLCMINKTNYDLVVFKINQYSNRAHPIYINKGDSSKIFAEDTLSLCFFFGKDWINSNSFPDHKFESALGTSGGFFSKYPKSSITIFNNKYVLVDAQHPNKQKSNRSQRPYYVTAISAKNDSIAFKFGKLKPIIQSDTL